MFPLLLPPRSAGSESLLHPPRVISWSGYDPVTASRSMASLNRRPLPPRVGTIRRHVGAVELKGTHTLPTAQSEAHLVLPRERRILSPPESGSLSTPAGSLACPRAGNRPAQS